MARHSKTGMRGLYRDSKGRFRIDLRWREPGTGEYRRYREKLPAAIPAAAAKLRAREILRAALAGGFDPHRAAPRRLSVAFEEYRMWCEANRPRQAKRRATCVKRLVSSIGDKLLGDLCPLDVERFKRDRQAAGAKPATVNRDIEVLSHFCGLAESWDWLDPAKARAVRGVSHLKEPPGRVRYLTADEELRLLASLPARVRPIVQAAILSGMRQSELLGLRKTDVDFGSGVITLTRTKANRVRRVYVNDALAAVLRGAVGSSTCDHVFTSSRGKQAYTADGVRTMFRRAVAKAKIADFRFHDLRHTTATRLRQAGVGIDAIADVLGHSTLAMARRYTHLGSETLRAAMRTLDQEAAPAPVVELSVVKNGGE